MPNVDTEQVAALAERLADRVPDLPAPGPDHQGWQRYDNPALVCLNVSLSIRNNYKRAVLPRMAKFAEEYPDIDSLEKLRAFIDRVGIEGFGEVWNFRAKHRIEMVRNLCDFFIDYRDTNGFTDDMEAVRDWAATVDVTVKRPVSVKGIGLTAVQHMRVVAGHDTLTVGEYLQEGIEELLGEAVSLPEAILIAEQAGAKAGAPVSRVAYGIWMSWREARGMEE